MSQAQNPPYGSDHKKTEGTNKTLKDMITQIVSKYRRGWTVKVKTTQKPDNSRINS